MVVELWYCRRTQYYFNLKDEKTQRTAWTLAVRTVHCAALMTAVQGLRQPNVIPSWLHRTAKLLSSFEELLGQIPVETPTTAIEDFRDFPHPLKQITGTFVKLGHVCFLRSEVIIRNRPIIRLYAVYNIARKCTRKREQPIKNQPVIRDPCSSSLNIS